MNKQRTDKHHALDENSSPSPIFTRKDLFHSLAFYVDTLDRSLEKVYQKKIAAGDPVDQTLIEAMHKSQHLKIRILDLYTQECN